MKYLIILLIPLIASANVRWDALDKDQLRILIKKCGYDEPNLKLFRKKVTSVQLDCLESKISEAENIVTKSRNRVQNRKTLSLKLGQYNCSAMNAGFIKDLCNYYKR